MKDFGLVSINEKEIHINDVFKYKQKFRELLAKTFNDKELEKWEIPDIFTLQISAIYTMMIDIIIKYEQIYAMDNVFNEFLEKMIRYYNEFKKVRM